MYVQVILMDDVLNHIPTPRLIMGSKTIGCSATAIHISLKLPIETSESL